MSNNPNFVSELVQMAKAFEELPVVQGQLAESRQQVTEKDITIHELETRIMDLASALNDARSATVKAEVERDHAETMFLETDDKLQKVLGIFGHFKGEVDAYTKAAEPVVVAQDAAKEDHDRHVAELEPLPSNPPPLDYGRPLDPEMDLSGRPAQTNEPLPATNTGGQSGTTSPGEGGGSGSTDSAGESPLPVATEDSSLNAGTISETTAAPMTSTDPGQSEPGPTASTETTLSETATSTSAEPDSPASPQQSTSSPPQDDVGYHNEPQIVDTASHHEWNMWCDRMDRRYGPNAWPSRSEAAAS